MELGHIGEFGMLKLHKKNLLNGVKMQAKFLQLLCVLEAAQSKFQDTLLPARGFLTILIQTFGANFIDDYSKKV